MNKLTTHRRESWRNTNTQTISNHLVFPTVPSRRIQTAVGWWSIVSASGCWSERGFPCRSWELVRPARCCQPARRPSVAELHCCRTREGKLAGTQSLGTLRISGPSDSCTTHWTAFLPWSSLDDKRHILVTCWLLEISVMRAVILTCYTCLFKFPVNFDF